MSFDFDAWREHYDEMTWPDHVATYSELHRLYPVQRHFDAQACSRFLDLMQPDTVLEIGGWDGELASLALQKASWIRSWENIEVCHSVVDVPLCDDPRYTARLGPAILKSADALVMSHVAEHMRWEELRFLFGRITTKAIYLASPLPTDGSDPNWDHYPGTHILEAGWDVIDQDLIGRGFHMMREPRTHEVTCWAR